MNTVETVSSITLVMLVMLLFSYHPFTLSRAQGQTLQRCPDGYNRSPSGFCLPVTSSQFVNPYGYPTTTLNPNIPQTTFAHPSSSLTSSLVSPSLINTCRTAVPIVSITACNCLWRNVYYDNFRIFRRR